MRRWIIEDHPDIADDGVDQLAEYSKRQGLLWNERRFGVVDEAGAPTAVTNCARKTPRRGLRTSSRCPRHAVVATLAHLSHTRHGTGEIGGSRLALHHRRRR